MAIITREGKGSALSHTEMDNNFVELDTIPNGKVFPKEADKGIKIDTASPDFGWHDLQGQMIIDYDDPGHAVFSPLVGGLKALKFSEGGSAYFAFHLPHDYALGTDIFIHVHWTHNDSLITDGAVTWGFEMAYEKGHGQTPTGQHKLLAIPQTVPLTPMTHMIAESACSVVGGSGTQLDTNELEPDGIIFAKMYLDSDDIISTGSHDIFAFFVDIHYQSTGLGTKNKEPNFYA